MKRTVFPFTALVGQDAMRSALLLNAVDAGLGGVLIRGQKGTAKSTAARALVQLLPEIEVAKGCPFGCDPAPHGAHCPECRAALASGQPLERERRPMRIVDLPLGATEDRVVGTLDIERALKTGERRFEPGVLAQAHRGILYVDEVNLLDDHIVDLLLDAAATGLNVVEREGITYSHPARFILVGTMNPEEGELRPQLLDRFGLCVSVEGVLDIPSRVEIVRRTQAFKADPTAFIQAWEPEQQALRTRLLGAQAHLDMVEVPDAMIEMAARISVGMGVQGHRADMAMVVTARAMAAMAQRDEVVEADIMVAAELVLPHRMRRKPFEEPHLDKQQLQQVAAPPPPSEPDPESQSTSEHAHRHHGGEARSDASQETRIAAGKPFQARPFTPPTDHRVRTGDGKRVTTRTEVGAGRYVGSRMPEGKPRDIAFDATFRAAAPHQVERSTGSHARSEASFEPGNGHLALKLKTTDLREKVRERKVGTLVLFLVDASGSMGAQGRMEETKAAVLSLLTEAYQKRDRVGLIAFRGDRAELVLEPTDSVELARERMENLPVGGRTPLVAGLAKSLEVLARERARRPDRVSLLVVLTDGRGNVGQEADLESVCTSLQATATLRIVIDTETSRVNTQAAQRLAEHLEGPCIRMDDLHAEAIVEAVRHATS